MIDVIIGLVLVIALASLVVSILTELHSSLFGTRAAMLKQQLNSIGGDHAAFTSALLASPLLKSISRFNGKEEDKDKQRPPSYISGDMFVAALLDRLDSHTGGQRAADPAALVAQLSVAPPAEFAGVVDNLKTLVKGAEQDWATFEGRLVAWYDEVGNRTSGWFVRQNQVRLLGYGFLLAATLNINPFVISDTLWHDAGLRQTMVAQAELAVNAYNADKTGTPAKPRDPAAKEVLATDAALSELRAQLDAWYRKKEQASVAADHPDVKLLLETQKSVTEARTYLDRDRKAGATTAFPQARADLDVLIKSLPNFAKNGLEPKKASDSLDQLVKRLETAWENERAKRGGEPAATGSLAALDSYCGKQDEADNGLCSRLQKAGVFDEVAMPIGWSYKNWPKMFAFDCAPRPDAKAKESPPVACPSNMRDMMGDSGTLHNLPLAIAGWMATALALSLGAPFWFDLLGKLVKMRSSGAKPELPADTAKAGEASASTAGVLARPPELAPAGATELLSAPALKLLPFSDAVNDTEHRLTAEEVTRLQRALGMPASEQSGRLDGTTRTYLQKWQKSQLADATGELTATQAVALLHPTEEDDYVG